MSGPAPAAENGSRGVSLSGRPFMEHVPSEPIDPDDAAAGWSQGRWRDRQPRPRASLDEPGYLLAELLARSALCAVTPPALWPLWWLGGW